MKARTEYMQLLASVDVHAPGKLRTNVQLPNFDEFHKELTSKKANGMWRAPEDRVIIGNNDEICPKWMDFFIFCRCKGLHND